MPGPTETRPVSRTRSSLNARASRILSERCHKLGGLLSAASFRGPRTAGVARSGAGRGRSLHPGRDSRYSALRALYVGRSIVRVFMPWPYYPGLSLLHYVNRAADEEAPD
jgi:hypothetical protein